MKVMHLEIDAGLREVLTKKLSAAGILAMSFHKRPEEGKNGYPEDLDDLERKYDPPTNNEHRVGVEIFAEPESFARIIKTIVRLGRDGMLANFPIKILSIRPAF